MTYVSEANGDLETSTVKGNTMGYTRQQVERPGLLWTTGMAVVLICWLAIDTSAVFAAPPTATGYHRPCTAGDIAGTWEVVKHRALIAFDEKDKASSYFHAHQRYQFSPDGTLKSMTSNRPFEGADSGVFDRVPKVISYHFPSSGQLETTRTDVPGYRELWVCHFVTKHVADAAQQVDLRPGDVVMTLLNGEGKPIYIRQLRRLDN